MIIAVDLMGGDLGPRETSIGLLHVAAKFPDTTFYAIGQPDFLATYFQSKPSNVILKPAEEVIKMETTVTEATRLGERSSMGTAIGMVQRKEADLCLSCGNTAGLMALAYFILKTKPGVRRPAIISSIIHGSHHTYVADLGANILLKPEDFYANAKLASELLNKPSPSIALLNIGKEDNKGTPLLKEASSLLKDSDLNYIGYIEGNEVLAKKADIILFDGFVGNCLTKFMESLLQLVSPMVEDPSKLPRLHHAALLAGLNGPVFKAHGNSNASNFANALTDILSSFIKTDA